MVVSAFQRAKEKNYKDDFYADGTKLFCIACRHVVDHKQNSSRAIPRQQTITSLHKNISECQGININLVKTLVKANIPLEKIDSLKSFFKENFKEGGGIVGSNQLHEHYLPIVYEQAINKIMNEVSSKTISRARTYAIVNGPGCPCFDKPKITRTRLTNEIKPMVNNVF
ncbi:7639_t:CDS:2 [Entrophospora sp. SA101]|nr:7639_t:CDS:2 [Entrophospora sp. SA101]